MKQYTASEELIEIFKMNGFQDTTSVKYPSHFDRLVKDGYDPHKVKRSLSLGNSDVIFDYIMIKPVYRLSNGSDMGTSFTEKEIRSIIAFYKLPHQTRNGLKRNGQSIIRLYEYYDSIKKTEFLRKEKKHNLIVEAIESVIIN